MATLNSQSILIIGGSSGIGYSVAEGSLKSHADLVIVASSNATRVESAVKRLESANLGSGKIKGEVVDASDAGSIKDLLSRVGEIDHLVFTSGGRLTFADPKDTEAYKGSFDVRFWGPAVAAHHAKIRAGGSVTLTNGTVCCLKPQKGLSIMAGVAGSVDALTRGLAVDLAPIRVNIVCPGIVATELWNDHMLPAEFEGMAAKAAEKLLVKHVGAPAEVAEAYLFLMKCTFITGQRIEVDGGYVLGA